jgi:hypothetical protein
MTRRTIKQGYVALPKTQREVLNRKYPFQLLKEGEYIDPPWPLGELDRVRSAVRHWNNSRGGKLHINIHRDGLGRHGPCVQVGWPVGAKKAVKPQARPPKRS